MTSTRRWRAERRANPKCACPGFGSQTQSPEIINDHILLYRDGVRIWRNDLPAACPGLDPNAVLVTEVRSGQLCRNDTIYTLIRGGIGIPGSALPAGDVRAVEQGQERTAERQAVST